MDPNNKENEDNNKGSDVNPLSPTPSFQFVKGTRLQKPSEKCFKPKQSHHLPPKTFAPMSDIERLPPVQLRLPPATSQPDESLPASNPTQGIEASQPDDKNASPPATSQPDEKKASSNDNNVDVKPKQTDASPLEEDQGQNEGLVQQPSLQQNEDLAQQLSLARSPQLLSFPRRQPFPFSLETEQVNRNATAIARQSFASRQQNDSFFQQGNHDDAQQGVSQGHNFLQVAQQQQGQCLHGGRSSGSLQFQQPFPHQQANVQQGGDGQVRQPFVGSFQPGNNGLAAIAAGQNQGIDGSIINQQGNHEFHQPYYGSTGAPFFMYQGQGGVPPQQRLGVYGHGYYGGEGGCMGPYGGYHPSLQYVAVSNQQVSCADSASTGIPPVVHADAVRRSSVQRVVHGHSLRTSDVQEEADDITEVDYDLTAQRMQSHLSSQMTNMEGNLTRLAEEAEQQGRHREDNAAERHQEAEDHANERDRGLHDRLDSQDAIADARHRELMAVLAGLEKKKSKSWIPSRSKGN